jgi:5-methylcytosine-specific restriction endonuclease McrA
VKNHTKVYLKEMGFSTTDWIPCEVCRATAVDIHHIESRGMGGSKTADTIDNLMALCRECHVEFGDKKHYKELLVATHAMRMSNL